jgi:hypothetical protein
MNELVERIVLASVTNPELRMPLQGSEIPMGNIYFQGDTVKISAKLAASWDAGNITTTRKILDQPENKLVARNLEEKRKSSIERRKRLGIERLDSPTMPGQTPVEKKVKEK